MRKPLQQIGIDIDQPHAGVFRHDMPAADLAVLAIGILGLVEGPDIGLAFDDPHAARRPQAEGVDRRGRPGLAVAAMAIAREGRLARDLDLDRAAKATGLVDGGNRLLFRAGSQEIAVFGMLVDVGADEIAFDGEFAPLFPHRVEGRSSELRANSPPTQLRRHLGMDQRDGAGRFPIGDKGDMALDVELEALATLIVVKIPGHASSQPRHSPY
jgi:hypothetical protein